MENSKEKGKFIERAQIEIQYFRVLWWFTLDVQAKLITPTKMDPIDDLALKVTFTCRSCLTESTRTKTVHLRGDGQKNIEGIKDENKELFEQKICLYQL